MCLYLQSADVASKKKMAGQRDQMEMFEQLYSPSTRDNYPKSPSKSLFSLLA